MKRLCIYSAIFLLVSCKKEIAIPVPDRPVELVVNAELSSDSFLMFNLSETQNITDNSSIPQVDDATLEVMNKDSVILDVLDKKGHGNYRSLWLKPANSVRYIFRISKGGKEYWIDETMPDTLQAELVDTSRIVFQGKENFFQFRMRIQDRIAVENFYGFRLKRIFEKYEGNDTIEDEEWMKMESVDFILTENHESKFSDKHLLFTDNFFGGLNQEFKFGTALENRIDQRTLRLELYVSLYSEAAYKYYVSVNEHLLYQNDPFSQPTLLKGNVSNAFGAAVGNYSRKYIVVLK